MLDLYKLHSNPEQLLWYNERYENPWTAWPLATEEGTRDKYKQVWMQSPIHAAYYAWHMKKRWPEAESIIAQDPWASAKYAYNVVKGRWSKGEPAIITNTGASWYYVSEIMGRWAPAEPALAQDPETAYKYARRFLRERFKQGEPAIARSPKYSWFYVKDVLGYARFPLGEPAIAQNAEYAYKYAWHALGKKRWPLAEPIIAKDAEYALYYAQDIIKGPWPLAEPAIAGPDNSGIPKFDWETYDYRYAEKVLKDPHPETWKERYWAEHQS